MKFVVTLQLTVGVQDKQFWDARRIAVAAAVDQVQGNPVQQATIETVAYHSCERIDHLEDPK